MGSCGEVGRNQRNRSLAPMSSSSTSNCLVAQLLQTLGQVVNENSCDVSRDGGNSGRAILSSAGTELRFQIMTRMVEDLNDGNKHESII